MDSKDFNKVPSRSPRREGRLIRWVDGRPVPTYAPPLKKEQVSELLTAALSLEYTGERHPTTGEVTSIDPRFVGMTNMEVLAIRMAERAANGSEKAVTEILDRIMGKPKQSHESVGVQLTYQDYLQACVEGKDPPLRPDDEMFESGSNEIVDTSFLWDEGDDVDDDYEADLREIFGE